MGRRKKEVEPDVELVSTDPEFVVTMEAETRVDWFQMALMQAATGKLKTDKMFKVISDARFAANAGGAKKKLKSMMLANLHLFSGKQKKAVEAIVNSTGSVDERDA